MSSHIDRTLFSLEATLELAATGCYLEWDLFGHESCFYPLAPIDMPNDAIRVDYLMKLMTAGYRDKLLIENIARRRSLTKWTPPLSQDRRSPFQESPTGVNFVTAETLRTSA